MEVFPRRRVAAATTWLIPWRWRRRRSYFSEDFGAAARTYKRHATSPVRSSRFSRDAQTRATRSNARRRVASTSRAWLASSKRALAVVASAASPSHVRRAAWSDRRRHAAHARRSAAADASSRNASRRTTATQRRQARASPNRRQRVAAFVATAMTAPWRRVWSFQADQPRAVARFAQRLQLLCKIARRCALRWSATSQRCENLIQYLPVRSRPRIFLFDESRPRRRGASAETDRSETVFCSARRVVPF